MSDEEMQRCSKVVQRKLRKSLTLKNLHQSCGSKSLNGIGRKTKVASVKEDLQCLCQKHYLEYYPALKDILPRDYDYRVCSFLQEEKGFKAFLRLPQLSPDKAQEWKRCLESTSFCLFRVCRTFPGSGRYNIFKTDYACQHSTSRGTGKLATKKTGCKAELSITVKRVVKKSRSRDKHLPEYPTCIFIRWCHNHFLDAAHSLRYRDVGKDTMKEFIALYHRGYTPATAYTFFRSKLMKEWGKNFEIVSKDRRILPEKQYVYRLFAKIKRKIMEKEVSTSVSADPLFDAMCRKMEIDVILPAAGNSTRMGLDTPKPFIKVLGSHVIAYTIECFHRVPCVRNIILVVSADRQESSKSLMKDYGFSKVRVCEGGPTRHRSIYNGVKALKNECNGSSSVIVIHDGARPFVSEELIEKVAFSAEKHGAAGLVRPLVSTVIKGNEKGLLETALNRSDYRNSEMPQAFKYGIIAGAYEKCTAEDFDYGTECLLLALKYSQCPAKMLEGNDDLWKVTYRKDIPLMETAIKEKFTKVFVIQKSFLHLKCLETFQTSLQAKGLKISTSEKEGANTIICFLELPSTLSTASLKGESYAKQFEEVYGRMPRAVTKLNLMVVAVFIRVNQVQESVSKSSVLTPSDSLSTTSSSQLIATSSQLPLPPLSLSLQTQPSSTQHALQSQQHQIPHSHQQHPHMLLGDMHQQNVPLSSDACPQPMQTQPFVLANNFHCSRNVDCYSLPTYTGYNMNSQIVINSQADLPYPSFPLPPQSAPQQHPTHLNNLPLPTQSSASLTNCIISPHQPFNICPDISFSDLQSPQIFESQSVENKTKFTDKCSKMLFLPHGKEPEIQIDSNVPSFSQVEEMDSVFERDSEKGVTELKTSQRFLRTVEERMKNSDISFCLVGVVCEADSDVGEHLSELVWERKQILNGQVLFFS